ncbi:MAG: KamA family radical SAM protein [Candidatus Magasanikbacteria bacterium]|nr:KamA family radical SAM protein [Candidatus Magasanikbacteria bacterium]
MLATRLSPYLEKLTRKCPAIQREFVPTKNEGQDETGTFDDPLVEERHTVTRGLVHKYGNRALVLLTMNCAAYCRFCTRRRKVSDIERGIIRERDLNNMVKYIKRHPEIKELLFSGGDPTTVPAILKRALQKFTKLPQIKIIRVASRLPASNPKMVNKQLIDALKVVKKQPLYLMIHFEHPEEITSDSIIAVKKLQKVATMCLNQSISLKGVNDSVEILQALFSKLIEIGVKPYYHYRCDPVKGAEHFIVDFKREVEIFTKLRTRLSGLATPMYVIDAPGGAGKVPVPLNFWNFDHKGYRDFKGKKLTVVEGRQD